MKQERENFQNVLSAFLAFGFSSSLLTVTFPVISEVITDWLPGGNPSVLHSLMGVFS